MRKIVLNATVLTSLLLGANVTGIRAASVGVNGYTNSFASQPPAVDWSTASLTGGAADITSAASMDAAVQGVAASSVGTQAGSDPADPPAITAAAVWSSTGQYLQTRPTGNGATLLMCTLVNNIGGEANAITVSYDFGKIVPATEDVEGHRTYYSLTGAAGSWVVIPALSSANPGRVTANIPLTWPAGGTLYLLWSDDNGAPSPDTAVQIDNISIVANPSTLVPVTITSQPQPQTVLELTPATFTVAVSANPAPTFQWYKDNLLIGGATAATFQIAAAQLSDSGAQFKVVAANTVSNVTYSTTSTPPAVLTVNADTVRPVVLNAISSGLNQIVAQFSERLAPSSVGNVANYSVTGSTGNLTISNAVLDASQTNLLLSVSEMSLGTLYTLTVNSVTDQAAAANRIATNSAVQFTAVSYVLTDIGSPALPSSVTRVGNGFDIVAGGTNISGTTDQLSLNYRLVSTDFDLKARLAGLGLSDPWAKAGLMARESLNGNSRYAASIATPSLAGTLFQSRSTAGAAAVSSGSFPVNYPYTWVRLKRVGDLFSGYASLDGENWMPLGSVTLAGAARPVYVGMAVLSGQASQTTAAQFRDIEDVNGGMIGGVVLPTEPPGPSSRRTGLVITEIMYKPAPRSDGRVLDFVEIYNSNPYWEDISGYRITGDIGYTFPPNTILPGGGYLVVAKAPTDLQIVYGIANVMGPFGSNLTTQGTLRLRDKADAILLEIPFSNQAPWPVAADGTGHSLVLARPSHGEMNAAAWAISDAAGGSPGRQDGVGSSSLRSVRINEFLANSDPPLFDYVELYNHANQPVNISGCSLSDEAGTNKFIIPTNTIIPARGFAVFSQPQLPFGLSSGGEIIYFRSADNTRVLDAVQFEAQANGVSSGRSPDGAADFYPLTARTPGAANSGILIDDIVINEIMFRPISGDGDDEYVELYNKGSSSVNLGGWRFVAGIRYTFPSNAVLGAGQYFVVGRDVTNLLAHYPNLNTTNTFGSFDGSLANSGERLTLGRPDFAVSTNNQGQITTNVVYVIVDEVTYGTGGNWGKWANEGGSSLELIDPRSNHRLAHNWTDSDETAKAPWTTVSHTGAMEQGVGVANFIELLSLGDGEYLVDSVEVLNSSQASMITAANSSLDAGIGNWAGRGTHVRSAWSANQGVNGTGCLQVRASARGDTMGNRALCTITVPSGVVTLRAQVRWLKGWPEFLLRLHGNHMEAFARLQIPANLGTPGARNSRALNNNGPAVYEVTHTPVLPAANEAAVVTARVHDTDGISSLVMNYRIDPAPAFTPVTMVDNGTGGDAIANDGIFSAAIPGQPAGTLVAFQITATDQQGAARLFPLQLPGYAIPFECLVRFGDPMLTSSFGIYRQWFTQTTVNTWDNRPALSNERMFGTFIYGNTRVIYNIATKYSSSPYHQGQHDPGPVTASCHYVIEMPEDDQCLGTANWNKVHAPGNSAFDENTNQREQITYWFARKMGLPWNYRRFVQMVVNGVKKGNAAQIMEDTQRAGDDFVDSHFPDDNDGNLYKIQPWFEVDDGTANTLGFANQNWCTLNRYLTASNSTVHFTPRYRQNWLARASDRTANDFQPVYELVNVANTPTNGWTGHAAAMESIADMEEWMRIFSVHHSVGDWDHFGSRNSQNMYGYKPRNGKWALMIWDANIVLGNSGSSGPGANLFEINAGDSRMPWLYANPKFRRMYLRALKEMAGTHMQAISVEPVIDARQSALVASGVTVPPANITTLKNWIRDARNAILTTVALEDTTNFVMTSPNLITTNNNLVTITGRAAFEMTTLAVNGVGYPLVWTTVRNWSLTLALSAATNILNLQGYDVRGNVLAGFATNLTIHYTGPTPAPENSIVFNEIMYSAQNPAAQFVEIYNRTNLAFDLSGWRINGLDYQFPSGTVIAPGQILVLSKDPGAFHTAYGTNAIPFDSFEGSIDPKGETLTLLIPAGTNYAEVVVDKIRYENRLPWSLGAASGASLQLIDSSIDNSRPSDWAGGGAWLNVTRTANIANATNLLIWLTSVGNCFIDDISIVATNESSTNIVLNGDFESDLSGPWILPAIYSSSFITNGVAHSGNRSLFINGTAAGSGLNVIQQWIGPRVPLNAVCTLSYWILVNTNVVTVRVRTLPGSAIDTTAIAQSIIATPGAHNIFAASLPPYDPLWLNELQASNVAGITDNFGDRDPWVEIYNSGPNPLTLDGYFLAEQYSGNLQQWPFPNGVTVGPRQFKIVWLDNEPQESVGVTHLHANFRLPSTTGTVALVRLVGGTPQITDYLTYANLGAGLSYGDYPDGQPFVRRAFQSVTPSGTNISRGVNVFINEWMAGNTTNTLFFDPADGDYNDWFELYNAGDEPVDLSGYYLTDNLGDATKYQIPLNSHYIIPPHGFLLVWADAEPEQNNSDRPDLHVSFRLSGFLGSIGLFAPDGVSQIDAISYGQQTDDVSQGRCADGASTPFVFFLQGLQDPSPRAANHCGINNSAPVLAAIGDRVVRVEQTLNFNALASDLEAPPQTLSFSLMNPPAGATIGTLSGIFTWTPTPAQANTTNQVTISVSDNGTPPLSDSETITIIALPRPQAGIMNNAGNLTISFDTIPGRAYRVEYKTNLDDPMWQPLTENTPAAGTTMTVPDMVGPENQRFYRIVETN